MTNLTSRIIPNTITLAPTIAVKSPAESVIPSKKLQELAPKHFSDIKTVWNAFYEAPGQKIQAILQNRTTLTLIFLGTVAIGLFVYYRNQKSERLVENYKLAEGLTFTGCLDANNQAKGPGKWVMTTWVMTTKEQQTKVYEGTFTFINGNITGNGTCTYYNNKEEELSNYVGPIKNGKYEGQGTLKHPNGDEYIGNFQYGLRHGKGKYIFPDKDIYEGDFLNDHSHGNGVYTFANGNVYQGKFQNDNYHKQGTFIFADTAINQRNLEKYKIPKECTGTWENDWLNLGVLDQNFPKTIKICCTGDIHIFDSTEMNGNHSRTILCSNGNSYVGETAYDLFHGKGKLEFFNGNVYEGEFNNDQFQGQGSFIFANGNKYKGNFESDTCHGEGTFTFADTEINRQRSQTYEFPMECSGTWENDWLTLPPDGRNTIKISSEGEIYINKPDPDENHQETFIFANGDIYTGEFQDEVPHGNGTLTTSDSTKRHVKFNNGEILEDLKI